MDREELRESFESLRRREFGRLDRLGQVYLDYTGSGLYAESQIEAHTRLLADHVLGNPHSVNPASMAATELVEEARARILSFFQADPEEYVVVFTSNASGALKLVGEAFPFRKGSLFTLLQDNHNSVNGIRSYADRRGARTVYLPLSPELRLSREVPIPPAVQEASLFAFPAQSNFSGVKHPLELVVEAQNLGYEVFLDAAAFVPTNPLDLSEVSPDYVAVSFYKMFGFPTGVGALLARKEAIRRLRRPWFAGGTVEYVSVQNRIHQFRVDAEAFEDGTLNFLSIAAVTPGLEFLAEVGMDRVRERVRQLTEVLLDSLRGLCHSDGSPLVEIYGPGDTTDRGGTVAFNLRGADGKIFPYANVEGAASVEGLSLRGGCFCNPGAGETAFDLPATEALRCFKAMPQGSFSLDELAQCIPEEVPVGALRASLGIVSTEEDLRRMTDFLGRYRDQSVPG